MVYGVPSEIVSYCAQAIWCVRSYGMICSGPLITRNGEPPYIQATRGVGVALLLHLYPPHLAIGTLRAAAHQPKDSKYYASKQ